ncbi:MAG: FAD-dependent oxidoreductase, partial [Myxococcales bacterium]|nr:FAD-dependent oxidoreductase [Myxococcales bacterium]
DALANLLDTAFAGPHTTSVCWAPNESHLGAAATLQLPALDGIRHSTNEMFLHEHFGQMLGTAWQEQVGTVWTGSENPGQSSLANQYGALPAHMETGIAELLKEVGGGSTFTWDPASSPGSYVINLGQRQVRLLKDALPLEVEVTPSSGDRPARLSAVTFGLLEKNAGTAETQHSGIGLYTCGRKAYGDERFRVTTGLVVDGTELGDIAYLVHRRGDVEILEGPGSAPEARHEQVLTWVIFIDDGGASVPSVSLTPWLDDFRDSFNGSFNLPLEHGDHPWMLPRGGDGAFNWFRYRQLAVPTQKDAQGATIQDRITLLNQPANDHHAIGEKSQSILYDEAGTFLDPRDPKDQAHVCEVLELARERSRALLRYGSGVGHNDLLKNPLVARPSPAAAMTNTGLARQPYIREARRILGTKLPGAKGSYTVNQGDLMDSMSNVPGPETVLSTFHTWDSVGYAHYGLLDMHSDTRGPYCHAGEVCTDIERAHGSLGFLNPPVASLPLRALVPRNLAGYVAAAKNLSVDVWANGIYRLHNAEWSTGAAAGALAQYYLRYPTDEHRDPHRIAQCIGGRAVPAQSPGCTVPGTNYCTIVRSIQIQLLTKAGAKIELRPNDNLGNPTNIEEPDNPALTVCP